VVHVLHSWLLVLYTVRAVVLLDGPGCNLPFLDRVTTYAVKVRKYVPKSWTQKSVQELTCQTDSANVFASFLVPNSRYAMIHLAGYTELFFLYKLSCKHFRVIIAQLKPHK